MYLLAEGTHLRPTSGSARIRCGIDGVDGVAFAVGRRMRGRVSVVGDFNLVGWSAPSDAAAPRMRRLGAVHPRGRAGALQIRDRRAGRQLLPLKADPYGFLRRASARNRVDRLRSPPHSAAGDAGWPRRSAPMRVDAPVAIYEVHLGSWRRKPERTTAFSPIASSADELVPYVARHGLHPCRVAAGHREHPFDGSWGYQPTGLFAPTSRFGTPDDFAALSTPSTGNGIGVLLDWVPAHFPDRRARAGAFRRHRALRACRSAQGRASRLGHADLQLRPQRSAQFPASPTRSSGSSEYHIDGLRVDAVASMLYLDYSRAGRRVDPQRLRRPRESRSHRLSAPHQTKRVRATIPAPTRSPRNRPPGRWSRGPVYLGGLGFGYKWNMGWMHDTLDYIVQGSAPSPLSITTSITFGLIYAFTRTSSCRSRTMKWCTARLAARQDAGRSIGRNSPTCAPIRFMWTHPGKKLLFMGGEFGQEREWNHDRSLDWHLLARADARAACSMLVRDLNRLYRELPALHELDCEPQGFEWIDCNDADKASSLWRRMAAAAARKWWSSPISPRCPPRLSRRRCRGADAWTERLNTDAATTAAAASATSAQCAREDPPWQGRPFSLS